MAQGTRRKAQGLKQGVLKFNLEPLTFGLKPFSYAACTWRRSRTLPLVLMTTSSMGI